MYMPMSQELKELFFPTKWKVTLEFEMKANATREQVLDMIETLKWSIVDDFESYTQECSDFGGQRDNCSHCEDEEPYKRLAELIFKQSKVTRKKE
jgi:hypothetical protein